MTQDEIWTNIISDVLALYEKQSHTGLQIAKSRFIKQYSVSLRDDKIEQRRSKFKESIRPHVVTFGRDMCNAFFAYWTETNHSGKKMRYELERTWEISKRLATWKRNDENKKTFPGKSEEKLQKLKYENGN